MLALLGQTRCRAEILDLAHFGGIERLNSAETNAAMAAAANGMLPNRTADDAFDLVFCWDLPNYLSLNALSALMNAIAERARPRALVHALVFYAERNMKAHPGRFIPTSDGSELIDFNASHAETAAPRYSPEDLEKGMGRFTLDRARLLGNGMQEFIFRL